MIECCIAADRFQNFFNLLRRYSPIANCPTLPGLEAQVDHVIAWLDRFQTERSIHSFVPKTAAVDDFLAQHARFMRRTVWMDGCRSGYKQHTTSTRTTTTSTTTNKPTDDGAGNEETTTIFPQIWPGSTLHCREALGDVRGEDWDVLYHRSDDGRG